MPYSVDIDHEKRLVTSAWQGDVDEALCISYIDGVWGRPELGQYDELLDFRCVTSVDLSMEALQRLVSRSRSVADPSAISRSVLVATGELVYGLSRMYVSLRDSDDTHQREWNVLDDIDAAQHWLRRE